MRLYYFSRRQVLTAFAVVVVLCAILSYSLVYINQTGLASHSNEPIYQGKSGQKAVAITVNVDWGEEFIPQMLKEFKSHNAKVTFFVTGQWAQKNPDLLKTMDQEGHSIQNHGFKHLHFNSLSTPQAVEQIKKTEEAIFNITGKRSAYFASPYGEKSKSIMNAVSSINYDMIMWSVDTIDWQRPSPDTIVKRVTNRVHNDAIILMHPTEPTVKALPEMLKYLDNQGYKMVTVADIIGENNGAASSHE